MSREGLRVMGLAIASIAAILASTLVFAWFLVDINGLDITNVSIDLREARACSSAGPCGVVPMSMIKDGVYPSLAGVTFWGSLLFAAIVAYQAGARALNGSGSESIGRIGHVIGSLIMVTSVGAAYIFSPDLSPAQMMGVGIDIDRSWGPIAMLAGLMLGHALYVARVPGVDDPPAYKPIDRLPVATARAGNKVMLPLDTPPAGLPRVKMPTSQPFTSRTQTPTSSPMPTGFKGKVQFSMVAGELTLAGIDGRQEDGTGVLVMWRDVVGVVVRRLPPELESHPFADVVSTAGMTLRILPWSKLTGEPVHGDTSDARVRSFVKLVKSRCSEAKLDRATQAFLDDESKKAAQLPNLEILAKHDQALA